MEGGEHAKGEQTAKRRARQTALDPRHSHPLTQRRTRDNTQRQDEATKRMRKWCTTNQATPTQRSTAAIAPAWPRTVSLRA